MFYLRMALAIAVTLLVPAVGAAPLSYSAEALEARVIDADTKQPVSGAVVVASWILVGGMHANATEILVVSEATTDDAGRFHIAAWGPIARPASGVLDVWDPDIVIVKSGYLLADKNNYEAGSPPDKRLNLSVRTSAWNHRDIELKRNELGTAQYTSHFALFFARLQLVYGSTDCKWKQIPNAVRAFEAERKYQVSLGIKIHLVPPLDRLTSLPRCQPVDQFLKIYHAND